MNEPAEPIHSVPSDHSAQSPAIDREEIMERLREIYDPELNINIIDLGLVYGVDIEGAHVSVRMTMTSPGCPMHEVITDAADYAIQAVKGVESVDIRLVWEPPWNPEMLSAAAKAQLGG